MSTALNSGVSGLVAHQQMLDVVGNNLANINTLAYKSRRMLFSDVLYQTIRPASSPVDGGTGGANPSQFGSGVQVAQIDQTMTQGNLDTTGGEFDFAIQGDGFFIVNNGTESLYTRAGAFSLDKNGTLVDPSTGFRVLRVGTVGEPDGTNAGFQVAGDQTIRVPLGANIAGVATSRVDLTGNLNSTLTGPLQERTISSTPYRTGGAPATASTLLNNLDTNTINYTAGDSILINGMDTNGSAVSATLNVTAATTLGDLVNALNAAYSGLTASIDSNGNIVMEADATGPTTMTMTLNDAPGNAGASSFNQHTQQVVVEGKDADVFRTAVDVYDAQGGRHTVVLTFEKEDDNVWNMAAQIDGADGTMIDGSVQQIRFNENGSMQQIHGTGVGDSNITIQFNGIPSPQTIDLFFGANGTFEGMTQLATSSALAAKQDGTGPGALVSVNVSFDGILSGVASNGRIIPLAQLAVASFQNSKGLQSRGNNFYQTTSNSGDPQLGTALSGGRGSIQGGRLESSNVDVANEFARMIVAQRGFSANARTINVADAMLEELTNLIR